MNAFFVVVSVHTVSGSSFNCFSAYRFRVSVSFSRFPFRFLCSSSASDGEKILSSLGLSVLPVDSTHEGFPSQEEKEQKEQQTPIGVCSTPVLF